MTLFQPGDEAFGWCVGSFAECASPLEDQLAPTPASKRLQTSTNWEGFGWAGKLAWWLAVSISTLWSGRCWCG